MIITNFILFYFKILFIYSLEMQRHRQREKQTPHEEPDVGLDPGTPGSLLGSKAGAQLLSHPGIPIITNFILRFYLFIH